MKHGNRIPKGKDLTNQRFGRLLCVEPCGFLGYHRQWLCKCDCGREHKTLATNLLSRKIQSCGCLGRAKGALNSKWTGCGELNGHYFRALQHGALKRKIEFSVSIEYLWELFLKQGRVCACSGLPIEFNDCWPTRRSKTASLDRVDSSVGYIEGNLRWVHKDINRMKGAMTEQRFLHWIQAIALHNKLCHIPAL